MNHESERAPRSLLKRLLLWLAGIIVVAVGLSLIFVIVCYWVAQTPEPMPRTVVDDPSLPSMEINGVQLHLQTFGDSKQSRSSGTTSRKLSQRLKRKRRIRNNCLIHSLHERPKRERLASPW